MPCVGKRNLCINHKAYSEKSLQRGYNMVIKNILHIHNLHNPDAGYDVQC